MDYFLKSFSFIAIIILGYSLRRIGFFKANDHIFITTRIVMNITLPATVIYVFSQDLGHEWQWLWLVALGLVCCLIPLFLLFFLSKGKDTISRAFAMINVNGYNIGCFGIPVIYSFFGPASTAVVIMFDIGNAVMMTGGSFALTSILLKMSGDDGNFVANAIKKLFKSVPFNTYMLMLILFILGIKVPPFVQTIVSPIASANSFLAMLMLGMMFKVAEDKSEITLALKICGYRFAFAIIFALSFYYLLPFDESIRQIMVILAFTPISTLAPVFTDMSGGDGRLSSFTNSISIVISLLMMTVLATVFLG